MSQFKEDLVAQFVRLHGGDDPEDSIRRICEDLLAECGATLPVDMRMLASFRGAHVTIKEQDEAGCIFYDGKKLIISTRLSDSEERQRFTVGHEISHTFFPGFREERRFRRDLSVGRFEPNILEEHLCDAGAAELLLPRAEILHRMGCELTIDAVLELAPVFQATAEATARRLVSLASRPAAIAILEPRWRKAEELEMQQRSRQQSMPGLGASPIPKKLRVAWARSFNGFPRLHRNKSVLDDTPLARALEIEQVDYTGHTGLLAQPVNVSARYMPYVRDGSLVARVIVILYL